LVLQKVATEAPVSATSHAPSGLHARLRSDRSDESASARTSDPSSTRSTSTTFGSRPLHTASRFPSGESAIGASPFHASGVKQRPVTRSQTRTDCPGSKPISGDARGGGSAAISMLGLLAKGRRCALPAVTRRLPSGENASAVALTPSRKLTRPTRRS